MPSLDSQGLRASASWQVWAGLPHSGSHFRSIDEEAEPAASANVGASPRHGTSLTFGKKMDAALFAAGFLGTGIALGRLLASRDPEPAGAYFSVMVFMAIACATAVLARFLLVRAAHRSAGRIYGFIAGAFSAGAFCAFLSLVGAGLSFWIAAGAGLVAAVFVAIVSVFWPSGKTS